MSSLEKKINTDYIEAYKSKNEEAVNTLRLLRSTLKNASIAKKDELSDEETIKVLRKESKLREESAAEYDKGERTDLAEKERREVTIIKKYLPEELSEAAVREMVVNTIKELNVTDPSQRGKVIGAVLAKSQGMADGGMVAKLVQEVLVQGR